MIDDCGRKIRSEYISRNRYLFIADLEFNGFMVAAAALLHLLLHGGIATGFCFDGDGVDAVKLAAAVLKVQGSPKRGKPVNNEQKQDEPFFHTANLKLRANK